MPASSRKRNKGKERKAMKAAKKKEAERADVMSVWPKWARGNLCGGTVIIQCNHGLAEVLPDKSHPVSSFIDSFYTGTIPKHPEVWNNETNRKLAADVLTRFGTNLLCIPGTINQHRDSQELISNMAFCITMLENYNEALGYDDSTANPITAKKERDLQCGSANNVRDLLKFHRNRITCSCLKKMHLEARKTLPKLGDCNHCGEVKERRLLMVCSRCMVSQYCSRKCQVAASPEHREDCDNFVWARQQQWPMSNDESNNIAARF